MGKTENALQVAAKGFEIAPTHPKMANTFAWALAENGYLTRADSILSRLLIEFPDNASAKYRKAVVLVRLGKLGEATQLLDELVATDHEFAERSEAIQLRSRL